MSELIPLHGSRPRQRAFFFTRHELGQLLALYSSRVASGEWRDYAIDRLDDTAIFSIFRHTHEHPLYAIAKTSHGHNKRPVFSLFNGPRKLKSSASLLEVLETFEKLPRLVSG